MGRKARSRTREQRQRDVEVLRLGLDANEPSAAQARRQREVALLEVEAGMSRRRPSRPVARAPFAASPTTSGGAPRAAGAGSEILIYQPLGTGPDSVSAQSVVKRLDALRGAPQVTVRINCPGGDVFDGLAIHNALTQFPGRVNVHVDGLAASAATLIAVAGDRRFVHANATFMIHRAWTIAMGDGEDMRRTAAILDRLWAAMLTTYESATKLRATAIEQLVDEGGGEWWFGAPDAVKHGFSDAIIPATSERADERSMRARGHARVAARAQRAAEVPQAVRDSLRAYRFDIDDQGLAVTCHDCAHVVLEQGADGLAVAASSASALRHWHAGSCRR